MFLGSQMNSISPAQEGHYLNKKVIHTDGVQKMSKCIHGLCAKQVMSDYLHDLRGEMKTYAQGCGAGGSG